MLIAVCPLLHLFVSCSYVLRSTDSACLRSVPTFCLPASANLVDGWLLPVFSHGAN